MTGVFDRGKAPGATAPEPGMGRAEFDALYRSCRDDVYAYVATLVRDQSAAEDVTATAFEKAYRTRRRFRRDRGEARGWLFAIARNAALDALRKRTRTVQLPEGRAEHVVDPGGESDHDQRLDLAGALAELEGPDRELIALRYFADLSMAEIATALGISESNAGTRVHRAVAKLRRAIDEPH